MITEYYISMLFRCQNDSFEEHLDLTKEDESGKAKNRMKSCDGGDKGKDTWVETSFRENGASRVLTKQAFLIEAKWPI